MRFIGCKTQLLENIRDMAERKAPDAESFCDIFSGSAAVARFFKPRYKIYSNDILYFSYCLQRGTIENNRRPYFSALKRAAGVADPVAYFNGMSAGRMERLPRAKRFFQNNYAPSGGRMYVTDENALRIDYARNTVGRWRDAKLLTEREYYYLLACIIEGIPFVSNISGTYGAFNKFWDARAHKKYELANLPIVSNGRTNRCYNEDGIGLLKKISGDILYIDPPYNERRYLPNYHVLETAARYDSPALRGITGQRSDGGSGGEFCSKKTAAAAFERMLAEARFRHIILSYNTDGIMSVPEIEAAMKRHGIPSTFELEYIPYRRFKSRNDTTDAELKEMLIYIEKAAK